MLIYKNNKIGDVNNLKQRHYVKRIEEIFSKNINNRNVIQLIGQRRTGKTVILKQIYNNNIGISAYINIEKNDNEDLLYRNIDALINNGIKIICIDELYELKSYINLSRLYNKYTTIDGVVIIITMTNSYTGILLNFDELYGRTCNITVLPPTILDINNSNIKMSDSNTIIKLYIETLKRYYDHDRTYNVNISIDEIIDNISSSLQKYNAHRKEIGDTEVGISKRIPIGNNLNISRDLNCVRYLLYDFLIKELGIYTVGNIIEDNNISVKYFNSDKIADILKVSNVGEYDIQEIIYDLTRLGVIYQLFEARASIGSDSWKLNMFLNPAGILDMKTKIDLCKYEGANEVNLKGAYNNYIGKLFEKLMRFSLMPHILNNNRYVLLFMDKNTTPNKRYEIDDILVDYVEESIYLIDYKTGKIDKNRFHECKPDEITEYIDGIVTEGHGIQSHTQKSIKVYFIYVSPNTNTRISKDNLNIINMYEFLQSLNSNSLHNIIAKNHMQEYFTLDYNGKVIKDKETTTSNNKEVKSHNKYTCTWGS